jgi:hypothetical protein
LPNVDRSTGTTTRDDEGVDDGQMGKLVESISALMANLKASNNSSI